MKEFQRYEVVLSFYPNPRGFAFVVFLGHLSPYDYGVKEMRGPRRHKRCFASIVAILDQYEPNILVVQDTSVQGTRRAPRITKLNAAVPIYQP